jgi:hypothetical protein
MKLQDLLREKAFNSPFLLLLFLLHHGTVIKVKILKLLATKSNLASEETARCLNL